MITGIYRFEIGNFKLSYYERNLEKLKLYSRNYYKENKVKIKENKLYARRGLLSRINFMEHLNLNK